MPGSWLATMFAAEKGGGTPAPWDDFWYTSLEEYGVTVAGVMISPETAMRIVTVFDCVRVIAETMASLPVKMFKRLATDKREEVDEDPILRLLRDAPNNFQDGPQFIEMLTGHAVLRGNGYARIFPGLAGAIDQLIPLNPARVQVEQLDSGRLLYHYYPTSGPRQDLVQEEVFHLRGPSWDGVVGMSPVTLARESLGEARAAQLFASKMFKNMARPSGIIEHPARLSPDARTNLQDTWQKAQTGLDNYQKIAILEEGMKWTAVGMSAEDAQFLETRKYSRGEIASLFRVPPHKVGIMDNATFTNIEHQGIEFATDCMFSWVRRWEAGVRRQVLTDPTGKTIVKFNMDALFRGDMTSRYTAHATSLNAGFKTINEVRAQEELDPVDGGDEIRVPVQVAPPGSPPDPAKGEPGERGPKPGEDKRPPGRQPAMATFLADMAQRIAHAEVRGLERLGKHVTKAEAAHAFFRDQEHYVVRVLRPIMAPETALLPRRVVEMAVEEWTVAWAADLLGWADRRETSITLLLEGVLS